jgi:hypothetical protein
MLSVPDASSPAASHSMRKDVHAEHEDQLGTQQRRASQEPQLYGLLLSLHISQSSALTDDIRHAWLAPMLHGTLNVLAVCRAPSRQRDVARNPGTSATCSSGQVAAADVFVTLYCTVATYNCLVTLGGTFNVLPALDSGCDSSIHHRCDALPVQLGLVRSMLQFCRGLQTAMSFLSSCCSCVEFKATPPCHVLPSQATSRQPQLASRAEWNPPVWRCRSCMIDDAVHLQGGLNAQH